MLTKKNRYLVFIWLNTEVLLISFSSMLNWIAMQIQEWALENMARLLPREVRLKLFKDLCKVLGEPTPERVWMETGIRKTDVYRYLPKSRSLRGGLVPGPEITVRIIKALLKNGGLQVVLDALDPIDREFRRTCRAYSYWKKALRKRKKTYDPLSREEIDKLEKSLY